MFRFSFILLSLFSILTAAPVGQKAEFKSFTGKVQANKVRLRAKPDLEGHIIKQVSKNDLFLIVGEAGDFYAVKPPHDVKAYVFRSYILDNKVEVSKVNVRLEPHADAPIIGQLHAGEIVKGEQCPTNHKWLEIATPKNTRFYVSKEYIVKAGDPEFFYAMEKKKGDLEELLNSAFLSAEAECKKTFVEMHPAPVFEKLQQILKNFADFPNECASAKEALALLKETYLNKKIAHLESKAELSPGLKAELIAKHKAENAEIFAQTELSPDPNLWIKQRHEKTTFRSWGAIEESLYLSWTAFHTGRKIEDFYSEQKANALIITGTIEPYNDVVKERPGDFLFHKKDGQIAYLYSTHVDLSQFIGKTISILVSPRPNNHFAYPAYFVLNVK